MKTLNNHIILYDAECPMCSVYTKAFVKTGMLSESGRSSYQESAARICPDIDMQRAVDEIALVNTKTGKVSYGIDSLMIVISNSLPVLKPVFRFKPLVWLLRKLYSFISYNRRVIIPHDERNNTFAVQPTYRKEYRVLYLVLTSLFTGFVLSKYAHLLNEYVPAGNSLREYVVCAGQIFFQAGVMAFVAPDKTAAYLGNMMTISCAGALALSPLLFIAGFIHVSALFATLYFLLIAGLMFLEHCRRMRLLDLGYVPSATWVLYRMLILTAILYS